MPQPCRALPPLLALAALISLPVNGLALESSWVDSAKSKVRLVAGAPGTMQPAAHSTGVEIRLQPGWHTYWRYAGDGGLPPNFDWSGSDNLDRAEVRWPAPVRIPLEDGLASIGYEESVLFPVEVYPKDPSKPVALRLKLDFGVCEKICIPASAQLALAVAPGISSPSPALEAALARVPKRAAVGAAGKLSVLSVKLERGAKPLAIVDAAVPPGQPFDLFAEGPGDDWALPLPKRKELRDGRARFAIPLDNGAGGSSPTPASLRLTLVSGSDAIEVVAPLD